MLNYCVADVGRYGDRGAGAGMLRRTEVEAKHRHSREVFQDRLREWFTTKGGKMRFQLRALQCESAILHFALLPTGRVLEDPRPVPF